MNINYALVGLAILLALALVFFLVLKNRKDRKEFEQDENKPEFRPKQDDDVSERL